MPKAIIRAKAKPFGNLAGLNSMAIRLPRVLCIGRVLMRYTEGSSVFKGPEIRQRHEAIEQRKQRESRAPMRFATASACSRRRKRSSAPVAPGQPRSRRAPAGVGIGTLYRHFPTREALFEAVYRREVQQLADLAEQLKQEAQAHRCAASWMRSNVRFVATKKGMSAALALAADKNSEALRPIRSIG
jgi:hypothetical protein